MPAAVFNGRGFRLDSGQSPASEFVELAEQHSGLTGDQLDPLGDHFQQWLYLQSHPTILPAAFD
jgi:hypothetical protein